MGDQTPPDMDKGKRKFVRHNRTTRFFPRSSKQRDSSARSDESGCDVEKVYQAMAKYVCQDKVSFLTVKKLMMIVNPIFPFTYLELGRRCFKLYLEEKEKVMQTMENFDGLIALSMDILRRDDGTTLFDYFCLKAHFIDDNWEPKSWVLYYDDIQHILKNGTDKTILKCLSDSRIENKISTLTPADGDNYDIMVEAVKNQLVEKKKLQIKCQPFQIYCCANLFRQMVEEAFGEIDDVIAKVSNHFPYWHKTLRNLQDAIELEAKGEFRSYRLPKKKEWKKLRYVCKLVEYIYNAAEVLFFTENPPASLYLHNLRELQASLRKECMSPNRLSVATNLLETFDKYWNDMYFVLAIATVMDPRCKMKYVEFSSLKYEDNSGNSQVTAILEAIQGIYNDYKRHSLEPRNSTSDPIFKPSHSDPCDSKTSGVKPLDSKPSDSDSDDDELLGHTLDSEDDLPRHTLERHQKCDFGFNCLDEYNEFLKPSCRPPKSELEWYIDEPVLQWSKDFDLMSWWRTESPKYPILSKMARDLLAIPFSVASSNEAYFYRDFRTADKTLDSLGPRLRHALVCTRSYFQKP